MTNLKELRNKIDKIDKTIMLAIKARFELVQKVADFKNQNSLPIEDNNRVLEVLNSRLALAEKLDLEPELIKTIFKEIIEACTNYQKIILNQK
ncbi:MAG: chorismate mutase [Candidatus Margulisiibacteriota bacterium]|jgi:chorismate mutase